MTITIIYDNYQDREDLETAWGFACVIQEVERTLLFDTGGDGRVLLDNMRQCGIAPDEIEALIISHYHWDHRGGIYNTLANTRQLPMYLPKSFSSIFKQDVQRYGGEVIEVDSPLKICEGVYSTGDLPGKIREQALILQTNLGAIVITGCAHPGIVNIVRKAKEIVSGEILLVMGGFHLMHDPQNTIEDIITEFKALGVQYVAPSHCSGDLARKLFQEHYQDHYLSLGVGRTIRLSELQ
jgi:7,8-dihydropterin-6-yl-methyl-4-(beta-D-ribofuranosyl)aminobenzene 5'-phosphate synthase